MELTAKTKDVAGLGYKTTEAGVIPRDWKCQRIKDFALITTGAKNTQDRIADGKYPFFVRSATIESINSYSYDGEAVLTAGDGVGTGKVIHYVNGKFDFHQRVYKISDFDSRVNGYYFYLQFMNNFLARIMSMTAKSSVDSVRMEMITEMPIAIPPTLAEQRAIATALSDVDNLITSLDRLIAKKKTIKQGAMQELLTGKKRLPGFGEGKGYKETELGMIPEDWRVVSFQEAFDFLSTASYSRAQLSNADEVKYIHYGDIHTKWNHFLDFSNAEIPSISEEQVGNYNLIKEGDLIMADASEDYEGVGKSIEVTNLGAEKAISGLHTFLLRDRGFFVKNFKGYFHSNTLIKSQFDRLATGLKVYGVSKNNLRLILIPAPPNDEQAAIARILTDMDAEIEALEARLRKTQFLKQGMMQQLLTGKIRLV